MHDGAVSRSSFDENGRVAWSQGDVIGVMTADNTDANLTYRALTETDASQGLFTMEGDITLSGETFYAYYPMVPGNRLGAEMCIRDRADSFNLASRRFVSDSHSTSLSCMNAVKSA